MENHENCGCYEAISRVIEVEKGLKSCVEAFKMVENDMKLVYKIGKKANFKAVLGLGIAGISLYSAYILKKEVLELQEFCAEINEKSTCKSTCKNAKIDEN